MAVLCTMVIFYVIVLICLIFAFSGEKGLSYERYMAEKNAGKRIPEKNEWQRLDDAVHRYNWEHHPERR